MPAIACRATDVRADRHSTLVAAPKQRNTEDEKRRIKAGECATDIWPDEPAKAGQKGEPIVTPMVRETLANNARWTVRFGKARMREDGTVLPDIAIPSFGYSERRRAPPVRVPPRPHTSIDRRHRLIRRWDVTDAAAHDGRMLRRGLLDTTNTGSGVWAASRRLAAIACRPMDSADRSKKNEAFIERISLVSHIHRRRSPGKPMPPHMRRGKATRSKHRAPIEPVFAVQKQALALSIRTIGIARAQTKIGLANIAYNIRRPIQIRRAETA